MIDKSTVKAASSAKKISKSLVKFHLQSTKPEKKTLREILKEEKDRDGKRR